MSDHIYVICDRSGSMASIQSDMEPAMNKFIQEQREFGEAKLTVVMFDHDYEVAYDGPIIDAPSFKLAPRGMTALNDAIGKALGGLRVDNCAQCGGKTAVVIITDGLENASQEWDGARTKELIEKLDKNDNFAVTFLGANIDAIGAGRNVGIGGDYSINYATTSAGVNSVSSAVTRNVQSFRSGVAKAQSMTFSAQERAEAAGENVSNKDDA